LILKIIEGGHTRLAKDSSIIAFCSGHREVVEKVHLLLSTTSRLLPRVDAEVFKTWHLGADNTHVFATTDPYLCAFGKTEILPDQRQYVSTGAAILSREHIPETCESNVFGYNCVGVDTSSSTHNISKSPSQVPSMVCRMLLPGRGASIESFVSGRGLVDG